MKILFNNLQLLIVITLITISVGCTNTSKLTQIISGVNLSEVSLNDINFDWRFSKGAQANAEKVDYNDTKWQTVNLPHDWSINDLPGSNSPFSQESIDQYDTGYTTGGIGWYRKTLKIPKSAEGKVAIIEFGGIYMNSEIYINGNYVGGQHYGYTSFWIDISKYINYSSSNTIAIKVNNNHRNSRWYSGSGLYRPVSLQFKAPTHIEHWGPAITTTKADINSAVIKIITNIVNTSPETNNINQSTTQPNKLKKKISLLSQIIDNEGRIIAESTTSNTLSVTHKFTLPSPQLWSPESPTLYTLRQQLSVAGVNTETRDSSFGIRQLTFDADKGFFINNKPILLKGLNMHHDNYLLGSAAFKRAEERKVERVLAAGYNAVRTSHNPPSKAFLHAADRLGLLVINEAFDMWNKSKWDHNNDYASHFLQDWKHDLNNFIKRDRNHPSVIMWSLGNEIPEQTQKLGADTASMLKTFVLSMDDSRIITIGANTSGPISDPYLSNFDVVGYNYQEMNYLTDRERFPSRLMYGAETYSNRAFEYWHYVEKYPYIIGDFVWTGWDYLGEASIGWTGYAPEWKNIGPYPWTLAYCGEIDALGYKRAAAFYRDVLWNTGKNKVSAFVKSPTPSLLPLQNPQWYLNWVQADLHQNWTWAGFEGKKLDVVVYSALDEVELFLNGKSLGKKETSKHTQYKTQYSVPYTPGKLTAIAYNKGKAAAQWELETADKAAQIRLSLERSTILANGKDIAYINAELFDKKGRRVYHWDDDINITFTVEGAGRLIAVGNGDPKSIESFKTPTRKTFHGRAVAVVQSLRGEKGEIQIRATSNEITSAHISLMSE